MAWASFSASFSLVGVDIRSTWATSTSWPATSSWEARHTSDDLPYRRGAKMTTSWPLDTSAVSSASSFSRLVNESSSASAP